jgi:hypothetical protein
MDEAAVRSSATAFGDALVDGNVDGAIEHFSDELKRNLGEVVALLPLPATEVTIQSVERATSAVVIVLKVAGEIADDELQTRWKDRDGMPRIVEIGHVGRTERPAAEGGVDSGDGSDGDTSAEASAPGVPG